MTFFYQLNQTVIPTFFVASYKRTIIYPDKFLYLAVSRIIGIQCLVDLFLFGGYGACYVEESNVVKSVITLADKFD